jgi:hypothetical protein
VNWLAICYKAAGQGAELSRKCRFPVMQISERFDSYSGNHPTKCVFAQTSLQIVVALVAFQEIRGSVSDYDDRDEGKKLVWGLNPWRKQV